MVRASVSMDLGLFWELERRKGGMSQMMGEGGLVDLIAPWPLVAVIHPRQDHDRGQSELWAPSVASSVVEPRILEAEAFRESHDEVNG